MPALRRHDKVCFAVTKATAVIGEQALWALFLVILAAFPFVIPATCHSREIGKGRESIGFFVLLRLRTYSINANGKRVWLPTLVAMTRLFLLPCT